MPAPKTKGKGATKKAGPGRKSSGDRDSGDEEEAKREYFRNKMADHRQQQSTPKKRTERYPGLGESSAQRSLRSPSAATARGRPGRPPESPSGPQTPGTRRKLNTQLQREKRHTIAVSRSRSRASLRRWHKGASGDTSTSPSGRPAGARGEPDPDEAVVMEEIDQLLNPRQLDFDENLNVEAMEEGGDQRKSSRTKETPFGAMSRSSYYDYLKKVRDAMAKNTKWQNYDVALDIVRKQKFKKLLDLDKMEMTVDIEKYRENYVGFGNITEKTISRRSEKVLSCLQLCQEPEIVIEDAILELLREDTFGFSMLKHCGLIIPDHLLCGAQLASATYLRVMAEVMGGRRGADRYVSTKVALQTAQICQLDADKHGDTGILKNAIGSSWQFANSILLAIKTNTTEKLFERGRRRDCIKLTQYPDLLSEFAKQPQNSRRVPGNETVSIGYKQRAPKFILCKPRRVVLEEFLEANPSCHFSQRTLSREWPQNVRAATSRDLDRNVCGLHSNMRRLEKALKKHLGADLPIPSSCRLMSTLVMCRPDHIDPLEPTTWELSCAKGLCTDCPQHDTPVPPALRSKQVTVALWGSKRCDIKNKVINNLHDYTYSLQELAHKFDADLKKLKLHIYSAARQWSAEKLTSSSETVTPNTIVTIEDYQVPIFNCFSIIVIPYFIFDIFR